MATPVPMHIDFFKIPISALSKESRNFLSSELNPIALLRSVLVGGRSFSRDFQGLAEQIDLSPAEMRNVMQCNDKVLIILELWEKRPANSIGLLIKYLENMDRHHIYQDAKNFDRDVLDYSLGQFTQQSFHQDTQQQQNLFRPPEETYYTAPQSGQTITALLEEGTTQYYSRSDCFPDVVQRPVVMPPRYIAEECRIAQPYETLKQDLSKFVNQLPVQAQSDVPYLAQGLFPPTCARDEIPLTVEDTLTGSIAKYDVAFIYASDGQHIVKNVLKPILTDFAAFKVFFDCDDMIAGTEKLDSLAEILTNRCRHVIIVISRGYEQNSECEHLRTVVQHAAVERNLRKIIPVFIHPGVSPPLGLSQLTSLYLIEPDQGQLLRLIASVKPITRKFVYINKQPVQSSQPMQSIYQDQPTFQSAMNYLRQNSDLPTTMSNLPSSAVTVYNNCPQKIRFPLTNDTTVAPGSTRKLPLPEHVLTLYVPENFANRVPDDTQPPRNTDSNLSLSSSQPAAKKQQGFLSWFKRVIS